MISKNKNNLRSRRRKLDRAGRRSTGFTPRVEALEARALLAAAIFDGATLRFEASEGADTVQVSTPTAGLVQIEVSGEEQIELGDGTLGTEGFSLDASGQVLTVDLETVGVSLENIVIETGEGDDQISLQSSAAFASSATAPTIRLIGGNGDDVLSAVGVTESVLIDGGAGNDILTGGDGNDILIGGIGDDTLIGGLGDDQLIGGFGADRLEGGEGNDSLIGGGQIEVTVTNLQQEDGSLLTPVFLATQDGVYDFFDVGGTASPSLERLAEDGITADRIQAALNSGGVAEAVATSGGPLAPGETRTVTLFADPSDPLTRYLSYASMVIPSNDAFIGNDDPLELDLFDEDGNLIERVGDDAHIVTGDDVYDAGTEVNDEIPENTAALAQAAPDTGETEGGLIRQHEGFQGSDRFGGPVGNVLTARPNGDFTLPGAEILSIEVDASVEAGFSLSVTDQPLASLTTDQTPEALVDEAALGNLYFNVHTTDFPSGAIRGQLSLDSDEVVDGVRTLTLTASLDSSQEPNDSSDSPAIGEATVTIVLDGGVATYSTNLSIVGLTVADLLPVAGVSSIHLHNAPAGTNGPVIVDIVQDAGGDINGVATDAANDTGDGNVFVETIAVDGDDILIGGAGDDTLSGGIGNDQLFGGAGNDTLLGGAGDDVLAGGGGTDSLSGGTGNDTNSFAGIGLGVNATVNADGTGTAAYGGVNETFTGIQNLTGSDNDDVLVATGAASNILLGGDGNDVLAGGGGTDTIDGGDGNDTNSFAGIGLGVTATINDDGTGTASYGSVNETFAGIENLAGSANDDTLTGNALANVIDGGRGDDTIVGGAGDDVLFGGSGDDTLSGGDGNDRLTGGFGADDLSGGAGDDSLVGGGQISVTVTNLQTEDGSLLTPVFLATQDGVYDFFDVGSASSTSLERLAEDGTTGPRIAAALASGGVGQALATAGGPLAPGESRTVTFFADPSDPLTQYLSWASMVIPSNDAFVANDDPLALDLFNNGELIERVGDDAFIITGDDVLDAGTEANDEVPENTAALAQSSPNTGVTEGGVIRQHEGFQGSERFGGPVGNVLSARPNSDFTAQDANILSIEVNGSSESGFSLSVTDAPLASLTTDQTATELADQAALNNLYFNVHTSNFPSGEIRGQLILDSDEVVDGVRTLTLSASLNSLQEPGNSSTSDASGRGTVTIVLDGEVATYSSTLEIVGLTTADLLPVAGVSSIHLHNAPAGVNGPVIVDIVQDAGGDINGVALDAANDTGDGNVFVETIEVDGNDILRGGSGNDTLSGGQGDDLLAGGGGSDTIIGGSGNDTNSFEGIGLGVNAIVNADGTGTAAYGSVNESFTGIENLTGSDNDDVLIATGAAANVLRGGDGNDLLAGGGGTDTIDGGDGIDVNSFTGIGLPVTAQINDDGTGTASYGQVNETFAGIESLIGSDNDDVLIGNAGINVIDGGPGNDIIEGRGGDDALSGGPGDDRIAGGDGNDLIEGDGGNDFLRGEAGDDIIRGGNGDDNLAGGGGGDTLDGGNGNDIIDAFVNLDGLELFAVGSVTGPLVAPPSPDVPTAVPFVATVDTTVSIIPVASASAQNRGFSVLDSQFNPISLSVEGVETADLVAGESYLLFFDASTETRIFRVGSSAGQEVLRLGQGTLRNPQEATDVNGNGETSALDALQVINQLSVASANGAESEAPIAVTANGERRFLDVSGDGQVSALDALLVINTLSRRADEFVSAEGEVVQVQFNVVTPSVQSDVETEDESASIPVEQPETLASFTVTENDEPTSVVVSDAEETVDDDFGRVEALDDIFGDADALNSLLSST